MFTIKCDLCGSRGDGLYYSDIILKTEYDIEGAKYTLCSNCSLGLRKRLDNGGPIGGIAAVNLGQNIK